MSAFKTKHKKHKIRQLGTILAIDIVNDNQPGYFNPANSQAYKFFKEKGLIIRPLGNTVFVNPPYCVTAEELKYIYRTIDELLEEFS